MLGDVSTAANLFATALRSIAKELAAYAAEEWYPTRIAFGQHKDKSIAERCVALGFGEECGIGQLSGLIVRTDYSFFRLR